MQPKDVEAFHAPGRQGQRAATEHHAALTSRWSGWKIMASRPGEHRQVQDRRRRDGRCSPTTRRSRRRWTTTRPGDLQGVVSGKTVIDEMRKTLPADQSKFVDKVGNLDSIAAPLRTTSDGVRFDTTVRGTPGKLLRSSSGRDSELRTLRCRSSCRRTCSPTSGSTAPPAPSRDSRTTRS